jgi:acetyl-CoA synthetase
MVPQPTAVTERVKELIEVFSSPDADAAWLMCDRHPDDAVAFTFVEPDGTTTDLTFGQLRERSRRFAGVLGELGVSRGDRVATLMGKSVDLVTVLLGIWRIGAVYVPLFTAFASDAVAARLAGADAKVVVVDPGENAKVSDGDWTVLVAGAPGQDLDPTQSLAGRLATAKPMSGSTATGGDGEFVHMFTSGTTGAPKGVVHPVRYIAGWQAYLEFALGVRPDSVYWCGADPGWAYGLYSAIVAPLALGMRSILQRGGFDAAGAWSTMAALGSPTTLRPPPCSEPSAQARSLRPMGCVCSGCPALVSHSPQRSTSGPSPRWACRCMTTTGKPSSAWSSASHTTATWKSQ